MQIGLPMAGNEAGGDLLGALVDGDALLDEA